MSKAKLEQPHWNIFIPVSEVKETVIHLHRLNGGISVEHSISVVRMHVFWWAQNESQATECPYLSVMSKATLSAKSVI